METTTKNKIKKITGIVVNVILWLFVAFSVLVTVIAVSAGANKKNVPTVGGNCYLSVQSNSMNATKPDWAQSKPKGFKKGDLIIGKYIADDDDAIAALQVGDIITFEWDINGDGVTSKGEYNTHRIVNVVENNGTVQYFETQGDNIEYSRGQTETVYASKIIAKYTGKKFGGVGSALTWLSSPTGFGVCIVLPLGLFFGYELFVFIKAVLKVKNEGKKVITAADEEVIKQRAIEEYLRQQAAANAAAAASENTETSETSANDGVCHTD